MTVALSHSLARAALTAIARSEENPQGGCCCSELMEVASVWDTGPWESREGSSCFSYSPTFTAFIEVRGSGDAECDLPALSQSHQVLLMWMGLDLLQRVSDSRNVCKNGTLLAFAALFHSPLVTRAASVPPAEGALYTLKMNA